MSKEELKAYIEYMQLAIKASIEEFVKAADRVSRFSTAYNIDTTRPKIDEWLKDNSIDGISFTESFSAIHVAYDNYHDVLEEKIKFMFKVLQKMLLTALKIYPENEKSTINKTLEEVNKVLNLSSKFNIN